MTGSRLLVLAGTIAVLACSPSAFAQGKSQEHKKSSPPSRSDLPSPAAVIGSASGAAPLAWIDDASLLEPGSASLTMSMMHWQGTDVSELDVPIVNAAVGLAPRFQLSASVPRIVGGTDSGSPLGGVGTTYVSGKIGIMNNQLHGMKLAVAPTLEILGQGVLQSIAPDESRTQWGLPVSVEVDRGAARVYASSGYFSRGVWFAGAGAGVQATPRITVSAGFSRAWTSTAALDVPLAIRDRNELSGGASFALTRNIDVFGSVGQTIATADENGAGTMVSAGVSLLFAPSPAKPTR